mmetsp:Transcript_20715/g.64010  ORF Transcript_20715/g.64010 Transcript_20715/m.64010 type:complete len:91 (+) Transcript_20715:490-762(+)
MLRRFGGVVERSQGEDGSGCVKAYYFLSARRGEEKQRSPEAKVGSSNKWSRPLVPTSSRVDFSLGRKFADHSPKRTPVATLKVVLSLVTS